MQVFAIVDLLIRLAKAISESVKRQEEDDAERLQGTKRSFLDRITKRGAK